MKRAIPLLLAALLLTGCFAYIEIAGFGPAKNYGLRVKVGGQMAQAEADGLLSLIGAIKQQQAAGGGPAVDLPAPIVREDGTIEKLEEYMERTGLTWPDR